MDPDVIRLRPIASRRTQVFPGYTELKNHLLFYSAEQISDFIQIHEISVNTVFPVSGVNFTPLLLTIKHRFLSLVQKLVIEGADVNQEAGGELPLTMAIDLHKDKITNFLLALPQIDVNRHTKTGKSPIAAVLAGFDVSLLRRLVAKGARIPDIERVNTPVTKTMRKFVESWRRETVRLFVLGRAKKDEKLKRIPWGLIRVIVKYI